MKKGIALLLTLGFIAILSALIAFVLSLTNRVYDEVNSVHIKNQSSILFSDVKKLLDSYSDQIENDNDLTNFLRGAPPFYDTKSKLGLNVEITPLNNRININSILIDKKTDKNLIQFLRNVCEKYNILDPNFFISLILDTIDKDSLEREALSEISLQNLKYSNGAIYDMDQFTLLEKYYASTVQDKNIFKVPWKQLIYFGEKNSSILDCKRISKELAYLIGLDSENYTGCSNLNSAENREISKKFNLKNFNKENNYYVLVKIYYQIAGIRDKISFIYNIKTKKVSNFELF